MNQTEIRNAANNNKTFDEDFKPISNLAVNDSFSPLPRIKKSRYKPTYTIYSLVMLGFGNTIGSGVFTLTGVASKYAGSAVFIAFIIAGCVALLTALVFAEFSAIIPKSGSSYIYTYSTFGELPAWIVGWN
jgi:APA family basic amino acid/polyamine antiporter